MLKLVFSAGLFLGLLVGPAIFAAEPVAEYSSRIWQSDEGLPLDAVHAVTQTQDGFLWVGTESGLARFDGTQFTLFDDKVVPGLTNAQISGLRTTRDGSLWMATRGAGLYRYKGGQFFHYTTADGLVTNYCLGPTFEDRAGNFWVATMEGLSIYRNDRFSLVTSALVRDICQDSQGNIWLATATGVDQFNNGVQTLHLERPQGLTEINVRSICAAPDGSIWTGSGDVVSRIQGKRVKPMLRGSAPTYNLVTVLYFDRHGTFWAGTYGGLFRIVDGRFVPELGPSGLPYGTVTEIFEDREGDLWVCAKDGLIRLKPNLVLCYTEQQGLGNDNVSSVLEDNAGNICIGTWGSGVNFLKHGVITTYTNSAAYPVLVLGLCQDRAGHLWAGTDFNEGIFELNGETVRRFNNVGLNEVPAVRVIYQDHESNMWVGTSRGLFQVRPDGLHPCAEKEVGSDVIRAIMEDHEGNVWIGAKTGLTRERGGVFTRLDQTPWRLYVLTILEDRSHCLWLGTLGRGLVRFRDGRFTSYTRREGMFSDNVGSILEDDHGRLWMGSEHGIFRVDLADFAEVDAHTLPRVRSVAYGKTDGMVNRVCNRVAEPSAWRSRDGRLWFATIKGLCVIDPNKNLLPDAPPPPVVIEQLHADQATLTAAEFSAAPVRLQPGRGELEFRYAALAFRAPEENRYRYKLEGVDTGWVEAEGRQIAHYNNIYPGSYKFRVVACNSDGIWNDLGASLAVIILPHFWQTWWFKPLLGLVAVASLVVIYKAIQERRLEIDRLRIRIAADLHDDIGSNLASISLLSQLGQKSQPNGSCAELTEINRIALFTAHGIREIVWFINPDYDTTGEMCSRMREVAGQMLIGIAYKFDAPDIPAGRRLSPEFRRNFFLIFKEIMHNIVKHSHATEANIHLGEAHGMLCLRVADNGRGFDPESVSKGNGLRNIRLRTSNLGGRVEIKQAVPHGTVIEVAVHLP